LTVPVSYPAQILDTELLLEFIGSPDGTAAQVVAVIANPRGAFFLNLGAENISRRLTAHGLTEVRPEPAGLAALLRRQALIDP
jgi:hypothetical protein